MMSAFFDTEFTTQRLVRGNKIDTFIDNVQGVGHIRPASDQTIKLNDAQFGELFEMFVEEDVDVAAADRVTTDDGTVYEVKGVKTENFGGIAFRRLLMVKGK